MRIKQLSIFFLILGQCLTSGGQNQPGNDVSLLFKPLYRNMPLLLDSSYVHHQTTFSIQTLKFYIGRVRLLKDNKTVWEAPGDHHLLNLADTASLEVPLENSAGIVFDAIQFQLGIDSLTNVSGAMGGDLDPTKGMYWTWQSGYINLKMDGRCAGRKLPDPTFHFHLGGYLPPYATIQSVTLKTILSSRVVIDADLSFLIDKIDLVHQRNVMSPGVDARELSKKTIKIFRSHETP